MVDFTEDTGRLYRRSNGLFEFSLWFEHEGTVYNDFGQVGEYGERNTFSIKEAVVSYENALSQGFVELDEENDLHFVLLQSKVTGWFANLRELKLRNQFWEDVDEILALTGLGFIDGASSGSGSMELDIWTVDVSILKTTLGRELPKLKRHKSFNLIERPM